MEQPKSRLVYILLALFLGYLGVHNFYAGYTKKAVIQLLISLFSYALSIITLGLLIPVSMVISLGVFVWVIIDICTVTTDAKGVPFQS